MVAPNVRTAETGDKARVDDTIVMAFANDPVARWCWPNPHLYLTSMPSFTSAFGGRAFEHASAHATEDFCGAALWLPPGVHPDEDALGAVVEGTVMASVREDLYRVLEQMAKFHPGEPHWYLPLIGVDPVHQGRGHGSALMAHALQQCDRDRAVAYLESTNPRNITLYQRNGFEIIGKIQAGASPPIVPMLRAPR
jgi:ribosomal protein S18 acetylase RimI-like enzyme